MSFTLTKDLKSQNQNKQIDVIYHHVRGLIEDRQLAIEWIKCFTILVDGLTKAFPTRPFKKH